MVFKDKISDLRGILVVEYEQGRRIGKVVDIFLNGEGSQIAGIAFKNSQMGTEKPSYAAFEEIHRMGRDVVIISSEEVVLPLPGSITQRSLKFFKHNPVTTHDGQQLGELVDVTVNPEDGRIKEIILSEDKVIDIKNDNIFFGPDAIIVPSTYAERSYSEKSSPSGILNRILDIGSISESVIEASRNVGHQIKTTAEKVSESISDSLKKHYPSSKDSNKTENVASEEVSEESENVTPYMASKQPYSFSQDLQQDDLVEEEEKV